MRSRQNLIADQIRSFLSRQFSAARGRFVDENLSLLQSGIIDSQGVLEIVAFLEQTFMIRLSDEELTPGNFTSIKSLTSLVETKKKSPSEAVAQ
jgi:acyl carrier protein